MLVLSVIGATVMSIIINGVLATYLNLLTRDNEDNVQGFTDWYGFTWWVSMPIIFGGLLGIVSILLADNHQLPPTAIGPTSLAFILSLELGSDWLGLASAIRLEQFWSIYLIMVGICQWTSIGQRKAAMIAAGPFVVIWSVWALFIFT